MNCLQNLTSLFGRTNQAQVQVDDTQLLSKTQRLALATTSAIVAITSLSSLYFEMFEENDLNNKTFSVSTPKETYIRDQIAILSMGLSAGALSIVEFKRLIAGE